jgi:hypothetical protein
MLFEQITQFIDKYNLPWLLLAIISWMVIVSVFSKRHFWHALPVGFWTMTIGTMLELFFIEHRFWTDKYVMVHIGEIDLFVIIGPFFVIGLLLVRFLPANGIGKLLAVLAWSGFATGMEYIAIKMGFLDYQPGKWQALYSLLAYFISLMSALGFYYVYYNKSPRL